MEFQEFWKERDKMCEQYGYCQLPRFGEGCPMKKLFPNNKFSCFEVIKMYSIEAEQIVKQWAKEHPVVTNGQKFHEIMMETFGQTYLCRAIVANTSGGEHGISYTDDWWNAEYQPPKGEEG